MNTITINIDDNIKDEALKDKAHKYKNELERKLNEIEEQTEAFNYIENMQMQPEIVSEIDAFRQEMKLVKIETEKLDFQTRLDEIANERQALVDRRDELARNCQQLKSNDNVTYSYKDNGDLVLQLPEEANPNDAETIRIKESIDKLTKEFNRIKTEELRLSIAETEVLVLSQPQIDQAKEIIRSTLSKLQHRMEKSTVIAKLRESHDSLSDESIIRLFSPTRKSELDEEKSNIRRLAREFDRVCARIGQLQGSADSKRSQLESLEAQLENNVNEAERQLKLDETATARSALERTEKRLNQVGEWFRRNLSKEITPLFPQLFPEIETPKPLGIPIPFGLGSGNRAMRLFAVVGLLATAAGSVVFSDDLSFFLGVDIILRKIGMDSTVANWKNKLGFGNNTSTDDTEKSSDDGKDQNPTSTNPTTVTNPPTSSVPEKTATTDSTINADNNAIMITLGIILCSLVGYFGSRMYNSYQQSRKKNKNNKKK